MNYQVVFAFVALVLAATISMSDASTVRALQSVDQTVDSTTKTVRETLKQRTEEAAKQRAEELDAKKAELQNKLTERRAAVGEKLAGDRMDRCLANEAAINQLLDTKSEAAKKLLATFVSVQTKLTAYVDDNDLEVTNDKALRIIMDDRQVVAESSVAVLSGLDFRCQDTSSQAPGSLVKSQVSEARDALKAYRDALRQYSDAVKAAITPQSETTR